MGTMPEKRKGFGKIPIFSNFDIASPSEFLYLCFTKLLKNGKISDNSTVQTVCETVYGIELW
jgi:hypothetical protein